MVFFLYLKHCAICVRLVLYKKLTIIKLLFTLNLNCDNNHALYFDLYKKRMQKKSTLKNIKRMVQMGALTQP
jgi:hypothetical protein